MTDQAKIGEYNLERAEAKRKLDETRDVFGELAANFHELGDALSPGPNTAYFNPERSVSQLKPELAEFIDGKKILELLKKRTSLEAVVDKCSKAVRHDFRVE